MGDKLTDIIDDPKHQATLARAAIKLKREEHPNFGALSPEGIQFDEIPPYSGPYPPNVPYGSKDGYFARYEHGSIYWREHAGAHVIFGAIRDYYDSMSAERRLRWGYPVTDEQEMRDDTFGMYRCNIFECTYRLVWTPVRGVFEEGHPG